MVIWSQLWKAIDGISQLVSLLNLLYAIIMPFDAGKRYVACARILNESLTNSDASTNRAQTASKHLIEVLLKIARLRNMDLSRLKRNFLCTYNYNVTSNWIRQKW